MRSIGVTTIDLASGAAPFDAEADSYDRTFTISQIGIAQRTAIWRELDAAFGRGQRVLEINCGSGVDAIYLAKRGVAVVGCDSSPRMIELARRRAAEAGLQGRVEFRVLATEDIGRLEAGGACRFDGILSNFAGLNCVENLSDVAGNLARLSRPGAKAVLCLFGRVCLWEIIWYLAHARPAKAFRRLRAGGLLAHLPSGGTVHVRYPSVRATTRALAAGFRLRTLKGVGVVVPPSYLEPWARRSPSVLPLLVTADKRLERCPFIRNVADHVLMTFERTALP